MKTKGPRNLVAEPFELLSVTAPYIELDDLQSRQFFLWVNNSNKADNPTKT